MSVHSSFARPNVFSIPAGAPFAQKLAVGVIARYGADPLLLSDVQIYVPTRRAARTLRDAFARALAGASLGPRIDALGDIGEDEDIFDFSRELFELPAAISPLRRKLLLAQLVQRWAADRGEAMGLAQAATHADALAGLLDEAVAQRVDLGSLKTLAPDHLAEHWQSVARFLAIVSEQWPRVLAEEGKIEPAARRDAMLRQLAQRLTENPPEAPVIAAGSTGSIPATAELLRAIAYTKSGSVVLPGLDTYLDDAAWGALDEAHAQFGLRQLLGALGAERHDVKPWCEDTRNARARFLSEALRPPPTTDAWRSLMERGGPNFSVSIEGLSRIEAANAREEAQIIAVALRDAVETPGRTAALVTPDRGLARRVASELARWDIAIDDSAGKPLARTPPGSFLCLLAEAAAERFAPVALLALLKHPLCAGGANKAAFRAQVRALERTCVRGLRPEPGLAGIAAALRRAQTTSKRAADPALTAWFARLCEALTRLAECAASPAADLKAFAEAHGRAAEMLAATDEHEGGAELWRGPAGAAAASLIAEMMEHGVGVPLGGGDIYSDLFRDLAETRAVRTPYGLHPRLFILGPLEARLQHFDFTILGGLNENIWPANPANDPWLSRPMRKEIGLEAPERRIGLSAHDFASLCAGPEVLLTRALKQDGAPTVPSRWWLRCTQLARGLGLERQLEPGNPYRDWARLLDEVAREEPAGRPAPKPPVAARPRRLSITEIETWVRDPYAIYAKHVLGLVPLHDIDLEPGPRERGIAVHAALEKFLKTYPDTLPEDALSVLVAMGDETFREVGAPSSLLALWRPRFARAARWFLADEHKRRASRPRIVVESSGLLEFHDEFKLSGRADRIDIMPDGSAVIFDYKTGRAPTPAQVASFKSPQLPLEAAMLLHGGIRGLNVSHVGSLIYLQLGGGEPAGRETAMDENIDDLANRARAELAAHIAAFNNPDVPYLSALMPFLSTDEGDYDHLARLREWRNASEAET